MRKETLHVHIPSAPRRNSLAGHPLLRKGGPHGPTRKAIRAADRRALRKRSRLLDDE